MSEAKRGDWKTLPLPVQHTTITLNTTYSANDVPLLKQGLVPEEMEEKWFIFWEDDTLHFHRSWTGFCIYIAHFDCEADIYTLRAAEVNRDPEQYTETSDAYDRELLSWLIDVLLLRNDTPYPEMTGS